MRQAPRRAEGATSGAAGPGAGAHAVDTHSVRPGLQRQCARTYPTEAQISKVLADFTTWELP